MSSADESTVLRVADIPRAAIEALLQRYTLRLVLESDGTAITGSFWGDAEAGIVGKTIFVRDDTPIHSLLHETCHIICMSADRRAGLERDANSDDLEETAVCYLQLVLADSIDGVGRVRLMRDMDTWGYSFRLGNTLDWFQSDADDAVEFLLNHRLLTASGAPTFQLHS
jgi:hypothetical protein